MSRKNNNSFLYTFLMALIELIILATIYFCLDVFGIIKVPAQYSIASLFYSQIEVIAAGQNLSDDVVPVEETRTQIVVMDKKEDNDNNTAQNPLEELEQWKETQEHNYTESNTTNYADTENSKRFYYDQLDDYAKIIYDGLNSNKEALKDGTNTFDYGYTFNDLLHEEHGTETLNNSFQLAINALTFDNPDLFYIDVTKMYLLTEITSRAFIKTYKVSIGPNGGNYLMDEFSSGQDVQNAIDTIEDTKMQIVNNANGNNIEKIKYVHDYIVDSVEYDATAGDMIYNVYGTLVNKRVVCEGYARTFKYVLDELGIPSIIVCGIGTNNEGKTESHAWNYVKLDNIWYAIDCTWDDPVVRNSRGEIVTDSSDFKYTYFLKGSETISKDHFEDGNIVGDANFKYPVISQYDY